MSDLKLYNSINKINDDLIEEAACTEKPVIHHCYGIAASAAAVFIAVGALGLFHASGSLRKTDLSTNTPVIGQNTTETVTATTTPAISDETIQTSSAGTVTLTTQVPMTSAQASVSYSKTSTIPQNSQNQTSAFSALAVTQTASTGKETGKAAESTITTAVSAYDYEYEGSIIMKKHAAALAALIAASGTTNAIPAQAQTQVYKVEASPTASSVKNFIDGYDPDLDLNSDGKFDLFDIYAMFRCDWTPIENVPDHIREKYEALTRKKKDDNGEIVNIGGFDFYQAPFHLNWHDLVEYYFTYCSIKPEYFDPNYYIDNCPDTYTNRVPLDIVKQDIGNIQIWDDEKFATTSCYVKNGDGSFRPFSEEDIHDAFYYNEETGRYESDSLFFFNNVEFPEIYQFISECKDLAMPELYQTNALLLDIMNRGYADTDIDSDGVYDFDDIVLLAYYANTYENDESESADPLYYAFSSHQTGSYPAELKGSSDAPITEEEWNKADDFFDIARYYYESDRNTIRFLAEDYLLKNEVDTKYFDPVYYEKQNFAHYEYDDNFLYTVDPYNEILFDQLGLFESFALMYGPGSEENVYPTENEEEAETLYEDAFNAAFPVYYKNVKAGVIPGPDIDLDGTIGISDYVILDTIGLYYVGIDEMDSFAPFIRRHPEVRADINLSQEAIDNYKNNFDFNNNGISCDYLESDCMRMYIFNELVKRYSDEEALYDAINDYSDEHPELTYSRISYEKMEEFIKNNGVGFTKSARYTAVDDSSDNQVYSAPEAGDGIKGDSNVDGKVSTSDVLLIMQSLANPSKYGLDGSDENHITPKGHLLADVDGNGVTNNDALTIQEYLLGSGSIE